MRTRVAFLIFLLSIVSLAMGQEPAEGRIERAAPVNARPAPPTNVVVATPPNCAMANQLSRLNVLSDGTILVTRADGNRERLTAAATAVPRRIPRGTEDSGCDTCDSAPRNSPPALPDVNNWLGGHAQALLEAIQSIIGPDEVNNELRWERGDDLYGIIAKRTETLRRLAIYARQ
jgi:hypothetical protein